MKRKFNINTISSNIKDFIVNNKVFLIYVILSVLNGIALRISTIKHVSFKATMSDLLVILLIGSFSYLIKKNSRYIYFFIWILFNSLLCIGNTIYYDFYASFISINLISTASMVSQVNDALWAKIHLNQFIYLIFPLLFIIVHKYKLSDNYENGKRIFKRILVVCSIMFIIILCTVSKSDTSRFVKLWNRESLVQKYGLYVYTINDLIQSVKPAISTTVGYDKDAYTFRNYYACKKENKKESNEYTNIFKGKNILFIHAESIQNFLINLKINDKYVTPNINKLASSSLYFSSFYPQISVGTSSDTEFTLNTGLLPSSSGTVFVNYYDRKYYSLTNYFKDMGYYTFSAHANNREYWNRSLMYKSLGYTDFYAKDNFIIPTEDSNEYVGLGMSDKEFFRQFIPILSNIKNNKSPYMGTIITLSNHSPFNNIEKYGEFDVTMKYTYKDENGKNVSRVANYLEGTSVGNYIKSSHYADEAIGLLLELLDKNGILDNTVLVFYGDHEARLSKKDLSLLYNYDPVSDSIISEDDENYFDLYGYNYELLKNTPLIIYSKDDNIKGEINKVMGMYDVLPTIANMFGFSENYSLGHDIFSNNEGIVVFPNGNVLTDKVYYSDSFDEYIVLNNSPIDSDYIDNLKNISNEVLEVSNGIIYHDLIKKEESRIGACVHE